MTTNIIGNYASLLYAPENGMANALKRKVWTLFFPLVLAILITAVINVYYFNAVDIPWLLKQMVANVPKEQKQTILDSLTKTRLVGVSLVGVFFLTISINLFRSFVYWVALKINGDGVSFLRLFAIVMWSTAPLLLILPASILNISLNSTVGMLPNDVNPVSLNQLYFHLPGDSRWGQMLSTISLINLWELFLIVVGLRLATARTTLQVFSIAILPELIVYGTWAAFLLT